MTEYVNCPMCHQSGCVNLLGSTDHTDQPPYEHNNIGAAIRLHLLCGACATRFTLTFVQRRAAVIIETAVRTVNILTGSNGRR